MATGIPSERKSDAQKVQFHVTYEGKAGDKEVLNKEYLSFSNTFKVLGGEGNRLFFGDNMDALLYMLNNGYRESVTLIYIDPPYSTSSDFMNRDQIRAYSDSIVGGEYIEFLRERLIIMRELLSDSGSIYLHLDANMAFVMKLIMDEVFGKNNCRAFITRKKCNSKNYTRNTYGNVSDYIMFYTKSSSYVWNRPYAAWDEKKLIEEYPYVDEKTGRRYKKVPIHAPGTRNGETGQEWHGMLPPKGKHWQYTPERLDELDAAGEICWSSTGNPRRKVFLEEETGVPVQDIWLNFRDSINQAQKTTGYPTEKNYEMLKMIIAASSNPGDVVMDCFAGSGTTLGAAYELGRQWVGVDNSPESIKAIFKRFTTGLERYGDYVSDKTDRQISIDVSLKCPFTVFVTDADVGTFENLKLL